MEIRRAIAFAIKGTRASDKPFLGTRKGGHLMSTLQIGDWITIVQTVVCLIVIIAIVIEHRRTSVLKREVQRITEDMQGLVLAEQSAASKN